MPDKPFARQPGGVHNVEAIATAGIDGLQDQSGGVRKLNRVAHTYVEVYT